MESYIHGQSLQDITSAVKKYNDLTSKLEFHIFDLPLYPGTYEKRLQAMFNIPDEKFVKIVPTSIVQSHESLNFFHDQYVEDGYEGLVVRNASGMYVHNERSNDVFKLKKALDAEYQVFGHELDKYGHAVFRCRVGTDGYVKAKLKGTAEERLTMAAIATSYYGKWLKLEYEMLSKDDIPLKPVGIMFRECDAEGNPTE